MQQMVVNRAVYRPPQQPLQEERSVVDIRVKQKRERRVKKGQLKLQSFVAEIEIQRETHKRGVSYDFNLLDASINNQLMDLTKTIELNAPFASEIIPNPRMKQVEVTD